jgi:hypothetical protein
MNAGIRCDETKTMLVTDQKWFLTQMTFHQNQDCRHCFFCTHQRAEIVERTEPACKFLFRKFNFTFTASSGCSLAMVASAMHYIPVGKECIIMISKAEFLS